MFPGVAVPVSDTRIFVSSVSRVHVSGDLGPNLLLSCKEDYGAMFDKFS